MAYFKKGILKVCKAFLSRIWDAVVFTQFGYVDSKSAPSQAGFSLAKLTNIMADKIADKVTIIMIIHHVWVHSGHFRVKNNLFVLRNSMFRDLVDNNAINVKNSKWPPIIQKVT